MCEWWTLEFSAGFCLHRAGAGRYDIHRGDWTQQDVDCSVSPYQPSWVSQYCINLLPSHVLNQPSWVSQYCRLTNCINRLSSHVLTFDELFNHCCLNHMIAVESLISTFSIIGSNFWICTKLKPQLSNLAQVLTLAWAHLSNISLIAFRGHLHIPFK